MKKIVTAMNEPKLNKKLNETKKYEIIGTDISYQEAVIEILEQRKDIEILIISELLNGILDFVEFIKNIKNENKELKIIAILEKENKQKINELENIKISSILIHNKTTIEETIKIIENINTKNDIEKEIEEIKKLILETKKEKKQKSLKLYINKIIGKIKKKKNNGNDNIKIISIAGANGTGKSIITACIANQLKKFNKKIIILDFDFLASDLVTIYGKNKMDKNKIIKINKNIYLTCAKDLILNNENINVDEFSNMIEKLKRNYDILLIDTSVECFFNYNNLILEKSDKIIFLVESNLISIKKSINLLKIFNKNWNLKNEKIKLIINKYNKKSIDNKILKNIFSDYEIIGKIDFNLNYNSLINNNMTKCLFNFKINKQYEKIINKILNIKRSFYGERINY